VASDDRWYPPESRTTAEPEPASGLDRGPEPEVAEVEPILGHHHHHHLHHHMSGPREALIAVTVLVLIAGAGFAYAMTAGSKTTIGDAAPRQAAVLTTAAVRQAGSAHVVTSLRVRGRTATYVNDVSAHSGREVISYHGARVTVLEVGKTVYVRANALALTNLFQSSSGEAQQLADKWLSFPSTGKDYKRISETLTLGSLLQQVMPTRVASTSGTSIKNGQTVVGLRGKLPGGVSGTLYVSATGSALPVEEVSSGHDGVTTAVFSHWGEPVQVVAPSGAIPGAGAGLS
jgi:hypothetical protein